MSVSIWTDGSSWKGKAGWAFVIAHPDGRRIERSGPLPGGTNNQAEMTAVIEAVKLLLEFESMDRERFGRTFPHVRINTDSKYTIGAFTKWAVRDWTKNKPLIGDFRELQAKLKKKGCELELRWVKGHSGTMLNDRADELAGKAMERSAVANAINIMTEG